MRDVRKRCDFNCAWNLPQNFSEIAARTSESKVRLIRGVDTACEIRRKFISARRIANAVEPGMRPLVELISQPLRIFKAELLCRQPYLAIWMVLVKSGGNLFAELKVRLHPRSTPLAVATGYVSTDENQDIETPDVTEQGLAAIENNLAGVGIAGTRKWRRQRSPEFFSPVLFADAIGCVLHQIHQAVVIK